MEFVRLATVVSVGDRWAMDERSKFDHSYNSLLVSCMSPIPDVLWLGLISDLSSQLRT